VRLYEGSLLAEDSPYGLDGGLTAQMSGGVLYDSRQPEIGATRGALLELSGRLAPPLPGGAGTCSAACTPAPEDFTASRPG
jgi:hypothetical protein